MHMTTIIHFINFITSRAILCLTLLSASVLFSVQSQAGDWRYSVRPGDTIWSICNQYTTHNDCWRDLAGHNQINNPKQLSTGTVLLIPIEWLKQAPVAAQAVYISGEVVFSSANQKPAELVNGQDLRIGHRIEVGQGSATLRFADGATIVMSANSELIIDSSSAIKQARAQSIEVSLPRGEVQVTVPKRMPRTQFRIKTPSAVAAVRGTKFRVISVVPSAQGQSAAMRSEVLEGIVGVSSSGESQDISAGQGVSTIEGQGLSPAATLIAAPRWNRNCNDPGYVEWQVSLSATQYRLALMEDDISMDKVISTVSVADSNYVFKGLEEGCYQVKVNAVDGQGYNGLESQRRLCYQAKLDTPQITQAEFSRSALSSGWEQVQDAMRYRIEVSEEPDFSSVIATETTEALSVNLSPDSSVNSVYVRVKALADEIPESDYSEPVHLVRENNKNLLIGILATVLAFVAL